MLNIGFSTGCLWKIFDKYNSKEAIELLSQTNTNCIELFARDSLQIDTLIHTNPDLLKNFSRISIHAPTKVWYKNNKKTKDILNKLFLLKRNLAADLIVVHPDLIRNWSVFEDFQTHNIALENMDRTKFFGTKPKDFRAPLFNMNFKFLLDLQHIYINDSTFNLCGDFLNLYLNYLEEIHISGFNHDVIHYLLYKTGQNIILRRLKDIISNKNVPIIIESSIDNIKDLDVELEFIKNFLKSYPN